MSNISMPSRNSTITYNITITNFGIVDMGILNISGLPNNLTYSISNYNLKDTLCDNNNSSKCKLGSIKTLELTIRYATNGYNNGNTDYQFDLEFAFKRVLTITYNGFSSTTGLPTTISEDDTKKITFTNTTGIPYGVTVTNATGSYTSPTLNLSNAIDNVVIKRRYSVTYVDFTGATNGLPNYMTSSGGTISFDNTTNIPNSINSYWSNR